MCHLYSVCHALQINPPVSAHTHGTVPVLPDGQHLFQESPQRGRVFCRTSRLRLFGSPPASKSETHRTAYSRYSE